MSKEPVIFAAIALAVACLAQANVYRIDNTRLRSQLAALAPVADFQPAVASKAEAEAPFTHFSENMPGFAQWTEWARIGEAQHQPILGYEYDICRSPLSQAEFKAYGCVPEGATHW